MASMNRLTIDVKLFASALDMVSSCLEPSKIPDSIGSFIHLSFNKDGNLVIIGNCVDTELEATIDKGEVKVEGDIDKTPFLLPAKKVQDLIKNSPKTGSISLRKMDDLEFVATFSDLRSKYKLTTLDPSMYPAAVVKTANANCFKINSQSLVKTIGTVAFAMANQDVRYYLNGMQLLKRADNENMLMTTTDGHRLAQNQIEIEPVKNAESFEAILSRKLVLQLPSLLKGTNCELTIALANNYFLLRFNNGSFECVVRSLLVDGKFPDWEKIIPKMFNSVASFDREAMKSTVQRALVFSNAKFRSCSLEFLEKEIVVSVTARNKSDQKAELDEAEETIPAETDVKESFLISFNGNYLTDVLSHFLSENVKLSLTGANSGTLVEDLDNPNLFSVLMPVR